MSSSYICKISLIRKLLGWRKGGVEGVCCPTATYTGTYIHRYTGTQVHRYTDLYFKYTFSRHMMWSCKAPVTKNKLLNFKFCKIIKTIQYIFTLFSIKMSFFQINNRKMKCSCSKSFDLICLIISWHLFKLIIVKNCHFFFNVIMTINAETVKQEQAKLFVSLSLCQ